MVHNGRGSPKFILRNKRELSRLQVLVEIVEHQPAVRQQEIAKKIGMTPQAVSEYIRDLADKGLVMANGRGSYVATYSGIEWLLEKAQSLDTYSRHIRHDLIHGLSLWAAIAQEDLHAGERAGLIMRDGLLYATRKPASANGVVKTDAPAGCDVGISDLSGIIEHHVGAIQICKIPGIKNAGSRNVPLETLNEILGKSRIVGVVGLEALVAVKAVGREPDLYFAARDGIIEAALNGMDGAVVVVENAFTDLLWHVETAGISYTIHDLFIPREHAPPAPQNLQPSLPGTQKP